MTLPWYLNPWAEVRRLRESCFGLNRNWCDSLGMVEEREREIDDLRKHVAGLQFQALAQQREIVAIFSRRSGLR